MASPLSPAERAERLIYRVAGLPVALSALSRRKPSAGDEDASAAIRRAFAARYWRPEGLAEWLELGSGIAASPLAFAAASLWFTLRNGGVVRRRTGKSHATQLREQLRLYLAAGILPPWYYLFSLHEDGSSDRARSFLHRFETKSCLFVVLKKRKGSPLNDKARFAEHCSRHGIRCVPTILYLDGKANGGALPDTDLFVKPAKGRGGRGAERWDRVAPTAFSGPGERRLSSAELLDDLTRRSARKPLLVQPRLAPHSRLAELTAGALPTCRVVTCLDERRQPEVVAAMFRMSMGANRTVDNMHAGGLGAGIDIESGTLSRASDLGVDPRLGWLTKHPDTCAPIEGVKLPRWDEVRQLATSAHKAFSDRVVIGWDIAILEDGPTLVEGNGNPDLDIVQRYMHVGLRRHRLGELIGFHLQHGVKAAY